MIFGYLIRHCMNKAELPMDAAHLEMAKVEANFVIQDLWYKCHPRMRQSRGTVDTIAGADEYVLNQYFDKFVKNTFQGSSDSPRFLQYLEPEEFFRRIRIKSGTSGDPYIYTFGEVVGFDQQLMAGSTIRAYSSLANQTVGTVNVTNGSDRITSSTDIFTINNVGLRFQKSGDFKSYKIGTFVSPNEITLVEKYRGTSATGANYKIGDVGIHVNIQGFVGGVLDSEDILLDGSAVASTKKTFTTLTSIAKSDRTGGLITVDNSDGSRVVGTIDPGEMEIERQTVLLWPKPDGEEELAFRFYMKHPYLWLDTDRILILNKWHRLIAYKLEKRLREGFDKDVPQGLERDIAEIELKFENEANDMEDTTLIPDGGGNGHGDQFNYDKDEDLLDAI